MFTRRLDNVTKQFPDVLEYVKTHVHGKSFIIDSEAIG
jgi:ATP-dependent DNA ligase